MVDPYCFPGLIPGNYFCWGFTESFIAFIWTQNSSAALTTHCCCGTLNTVEPLFAVMARSRVVSTSAAIFSSIIDGCLKYKLKEKPKTGPRPGLRLNYDVNIVPKPSPRDVKKSEPNFKLNIFFKVCCNASVTEHVPSKILLKIEY